MDHVLRDARERERALGGAPGRRGQAVLDPRAALEPRRLDRDVTAAESHARLDPVLVRPVTQRQREDQQRAADDHRRRRKRAAPRLPAQVAHGEPRQEGRLRGHGPARTSAGGSRAARAAG